MSAQIIAFPGKRTIAGIPPALVNEAGRRMAARVLELKEHRELWLEFLAACYPLKGWRYYEQIELYDGAQYAFVKNHPPAELRSMIAAKRGQRAAEAKRTLRELDSD